jgi:hypothetical protein
MTTEEVMELLAGIAADMERKGDIAEAAWQASKDNAEDRAKMRAYRDAEQTVRDEITELATS